MAGETIIAIVTIIAAAVVSVTTLITKSEVVRLNAKVEQLNIQIAGLHQVVLAQSEKISTLTAQKIGLIEKIEGRKDKDDI